MPSILLLDDAKEDRFFVTYNLRKLAPDAQVHEFSYVEDALAFLRSPDRPKLDLLLVDINMPRANGFEFADAYLDLYPELRGDARVYIMTGSINPEDKARAEAHEAVRGYIEKPASQDALKKALALA